MITYETELIHHGIKGMHWGIRRYQPYDTVGRKSGKRGKEIGKAIRSKWDNLSDKNKKRIKIAAGVTGTAIAGFAAYKIGKKIKSPNIKFRNPDGSFSRVSKRHLYDIDSDKDVIIKRGTKTRRISIDKGDPVFDNKKYMSLSRKDNKKWKNYIGKSQKQRGEKVYSNTYKTVNDLNIASSKKAGEEFVSLLKDEKFKFQTIDDSEWAFSKMGQGHKKGMQEGAGLNFAMQTPTGKRIVERLMAKGYDGVVDSHGTNVGNLPVILFDPENKVSLKRQREILRHFKV